MLRYVIRRLLWLVPMVLITSAVVFVAMRMIPVDPAELVIGPYATAEQRVLATHELGLDKPILVQYAIYLNAALHGNLGRSIKSGKEISTLIADTVPNSLLLGGVALVFAYLIAIPLGVIAAVRQNTVVDQGAMTFALIGISVPNFWLGLLLVMAFAVGLRWLPAGGAGGISHLVLPAITLGVQYTAIVARMTRSSVLEVLRQDFVRALHAKGLRPGKVIYRHVLKNAVIPIISLAGLNVGSLVGGAVIVETIFAWPGVGQLLLNSILGRDYPVVQAMLTLLGIAVLLANVLADVLYALADRPHQVLNAMSSSDPTIWLAEEIVSTASPWRDFVRRFAANRSAMIGLVIIAALCIVALFAPLLAPYPFAAQDLMDSLDRPMTEGHLLGTDMFGRDILSRLIWGARVSLEVGVLVTTVGMLIGITVGCIAGYFGGRIDQVLSNLINLVWAFPLILVALLFATVIGAGLNSVVIATGLVIWAGFARIVRGEVLALRQREFVVAAQALGRGNIWIICRHILPNIVGPVLVIASFTMAVAVIIEASLSFLGLGAQPPTPSWGSMLNEGRAVMYRAWWLATFPGVAIAVLVLGFNLLGDGLRDVLDPRMRN